MRAEAVVKALLESNAPFVTLVTAMPSPVPPTEPRIFGCIARQGTPRPFAVMRKLSASREYDEDPVGATTTVTALIEVLFVADTYEALKAVADAGRQAVDENTDETVAGVHVMETAVEEEGEDGYDFDQNVFFQPWAFKIIHEE